MRHPARWAALGVGIVVVGFSVVLALNVGTDPTFAGGKLLHQSAPTFDLPTLAGGRVRSQDLAGKTVVVNFFNDWCIPCRQEEPALEAFWAEHRDERDLAMVGIVRDQPDTAAMRRWARAHPDASWTIALDPTKRTGVDFGTTGQPETFVIGPTGVVEYWQAGPVTSQVLDTVVANVRSGA